jgi:hypothetical protein
MPPAARRSSIAALAALWALLALAGCATPSQRPLADAGSAAVVTVDVGGRAIQMAPIDGWCAAPQDQLEEVRDALGSDLVAHTLFADCDELRSNDGKFEALENFAILSTPRTLIHEDLGSDRAAFVDAVIDEMSDLDLTDVFAQAQEEALAGMRGEIADMEAKGVTVRIADPINMGIVAHDPSAVYFAVLQKVEASSRSESVRVDIATMFGVTALNGRAIILCLQSRLMHPATEGSGKMVAETLAQAKAQVERLIELNPDLGLAI